jgi:phosphate transport system substrate-binding protein
LHSKILASLTCAVLIAGAVSGLAATAASAVTLNGSGSTLVAPIEAEWAATWGQNTGNTVLYRAVGSGQGLTEISNKMEDFAGSDAPLSASTTPCPGCFQIPWALSATGVSFNVPGVSKLHLTGNVIAQIYLGQITNWSDHRITVLNKGTHLPNLTITPVHRTDGSGDSYAFTDYLSNVNGTFASTIGRGTKPDFRGIGVGGNKNLGMVTVMQSTPGAIAYIAVSYLIAKRLPAAAILNKAGHYEYPNLKNISNAASVVHSVPGNNELHIVNPSKSARIAYPISTFTYAIVQPTDVFGNGATLKQFIAYALTGGQAFGQALDFVPLPSGIKRAAQATLALIN